MSAEMVHPLMRASCAVAAAFGVVVAATCGGSSPAAPDPSIVSIVATGTQVFRMSLLANCPDAGRNFFPMVYSSVTVARAGSEWVATALTTAAGDVQVRFHQGSSRTVGNSFEVAGTIKGTAIHMPELFVTPGWDARANFGTDGRTTFTGVAFGAGFIGAQTSGLDGVGTGTVALSDNAGHSCTGSSFSWAIYPPQTQ